MRLSVLDQSIAVAGRPHDQSIRNTVALAQHCEALGYDRFWVSEHHNHPTIVGTAPEIAATTDRIRIGSAGIMLPHYAPFKVAEVFRVLDALAPGRIDLGLGRAPGSDGRTAFALNPAANERPEHFPADVRDLIAWVHNEPLVDRHPFAAVQAYPQGTTGGTLATSFRNKMTAFGAVIPGNERWWHTANERMKVDSAVQMTKMMADGMLEMARYSGPAGAKFMWASIPGLNADRADLDLLDVTIGTFKDASAAVGTSQLGSQALLGATSFNIPMWNGRGNSTPTASAFALGHASGGVYLPLTDTEYLNSTYVAPMRLEFKVQRPDYMSDADWAKFVARGYGDFKFNILVGDTVVPLAVPAEQSADKYFSSRISATNPDALYLSVNLAITDAPYDGVQAVLADSKTDLYTVTPTYLASNPDPFPGRGAIEQRGFFLFGDGMKNAEFSSPDAVYVTAANWISDEKPSTVGGTVPATLALTLGAPASFGPFSPGVGKDYVASTTATVTSTAGDATLTVADPSDIATGHLVNGAFSLPQSLLASGATDGTYAPVGGSSAPTTLKVWNGPTSNDSSTVSFKQTIGDRDALRTGTYAKTLTFTLSTTNP